MARSSVALIDTENITKVSRDRYKLKGKTHRESERLCDGERFASQITAATCSGALIAPSLVLTAGHCTASDEGTSSDFCARTFFVFDYALHDKNKAKVLHPVENVYRCREVLRIVDRDDGLDFALIELDRWVSDRKPLSLRKNDELDFFEELITIGHPAGLPQKLSRHGYLRSQGAIFFIANLDVSESSSGSPVINASSGLIEGIESSGEDDYEFDHDHKCNRVKRCADDGCAGESITKSVAIVQALQSVSEPKWRDLFQRSFDFDK